MAGTRDKVVLDLKHQGKDVKDVIKSEMEAARNEAKLPRVRATAVDKAISGIGRAGGPAPSQRMLPSLAVGTKTKGMRDKFEAACRNTAIMGVLGDPRLTQLLAKEQDDKVKRKERLEIRAAKVAQVLEDKKNKAALRAASFGDSYYIGSSNQAERAGRRGDERSWRNRVQKDRPVGILNPCSRVGKLVADLGGQEDWASKTILRHQMAAVIQAHFRGYLLRKRWRASPEGVVADLRAQQAAIAAEASRRAALRIQLEKRTLTRKQKSVAENAVLAMFGRGKSMGRKALPKMWGRLQKNMDLVVDEEAKAVDMDDGSESDMSDLDIEDVALVKMRAKTPPWQKMEDCAWEGQWAKLTAKAQRGNLDVLWDAEETFMRMEAVKERRAARHPTQEGDEDEQAAQLVEQPLPHELIDAMLAEKYLESYARMGIRERQPLKGVRLNDAHALNGNELITPQSARG